MPMKISGTFNRLALSKRKLGSDGPCQRMHALCFHGSSGGIARDDRRALKGLFKAAVCALIGIGLSSCASLERLPPVPLALAGEFTPLSIPHARLYVDGDKAAIETLAQETMQRRIKADGPPDKWPKTNSFLAISGGGDDGAFGAGVITGWTQHGDRPNFRIVTGISTGALTAPFAFLGPDYDEKLKQVYTETTAADIFEARTLLAAVTDDAMADTTPLHNMISHFLDKEMVQRIAEEYGKGRLLLIATTNLDQGRSVIWNIGAIAESSDPRARELIIQVLRASASIPGAFPPVMLDVMVDGKHYEEMHVDGGAVAQAFLYPPSVRMSATRGGVTFKNVAYVVRNGRLFRPEEDVKRQTLDISGKAIATITAANGVNDIYRIYLTTKRDGVGFNLAYIDEGFDVPYKGPFDKTYMRTLFEYGFEKGTAGYPWQKIPPGYQE